MELVVPFYDQISLMQLNSSEGQCLFTFHIYPTSDFASEYQTNLPIILSFVVGTTFVVMLLSFVLYDCFVSQRNLKVLNAATRTQVLVSSMFPATIQDRIFAEKKTSNTKIGKNRLTTFLSTNSDTNDMLLQSKPIADLFPETTVLFADIAGFTAWSSTREPCQVSVNLASNRRLITSCLAHLLCDRICRCSHYLKQFLRPLIVWQRSDKFSR
jgi:hypothetical protein